MTSTMRLTTAIALCTFALVGSDSFASADPYKVGATTYSRSFEFYQDIEKGMKEAGGDKVVFDFRDPNGDLAAQTAQMRISSRRKSTWSPSCRSTRQRQRRKGVS